MSGATGPWATEPTFGSRGARRLGLGACDKRGGGGATSIVRLAERDRRAVAASATEPPFAEADTDEPGAAEFSAADDGSTFTYLKLPSGEYCGE